MENEKTLFQSGKHQFLTFTQQNIDHVCSQQKEAGRYDERSRMVSHWQIVSPTSQPAVCEAPPPLTQERMLQH